MTNGVDYSWGRPDLTQLWAAGYRFVSRYLCYGDSGKKLLQPELDALLSQGFKIMLNWEHTARDQTGGAPHGTADAAEAITQALGLGASPGTTIYFSTDFDASTTELAGPVTDYLQAAGAIVRDAGFRLGVYGGIRTIRHCFDNRLVDDGWQTFAWSAGQWDERAVVQQHRNSVALAGAVVDLDRAIGPTHMIGEGEPMATSQNGWPASPDKSAIGIVSPTVAGVSFPQGVKRGDVETVLMYVARRFHETVEPLRVGECWGYFYRTVSGGTSLSNHSSGTAIDLNAPSHPLGASGTFSAKQVTAIRAILSYCEGAVRWGGDYSSRKDEMHFEINAGPSAVARIATKIKGGDDVAGFGFRTQAEADAVRDALTKPSTWKTPGDNGITRTGAQILGDLGYGFLYGVGPWEGKDIQARFDTLLAKLDQLAARPAVTLSDAQLAQLGQIIDQLVDAADNGLTEADKPVIVAAVKRALAEGVGS